MFTPWRRRSVLPLTGARANQHSRYTPDRSMTLLVPVRALVARRGGGVEVGSLAEPGWVGVVGPVGAAHVGIGVREDTLGAFPTGNHPRVHHPAGRGHELAVHRPALG